MHRKKVVIIGSGLGGLSCGVILAKNGFHVTVLEKESQIGGCLQCFTRCGAKFETGMHFIGSARKGQTLHRFLNYLEVFDDIRLSPLDASGYDVVSLGGEKYRFANGREGFIDQMSAYFPRQRDNLCKYFDLVGQVAHASSLHSLNDVESDAVINTKYQMRSINAVIEEVISDPLLAKVLVGNLPLYAAERDKTPFSTHAFIMDFYNQSAFRIVGGSDAVAVSMRKTIERYGGSVFTRRKATRIVCVETNAVGVEVGGGDFLPADYVISDAHPLRTLELIESPIIRPAYRRRLQAIPQTVGGFSVYLDFKADTLPYMNYNYYGYSGNTPWGCENYDGKSWPQGFLYMHFCDRMPMRYANSGVILSYMRMEELKPWFGTSVGHRGDSYNKFKEEKAESLLDSLERHFPGTRSCINTYYTSTPLTYLDYTGTEGGSLYGVVKDVTAGPAYRVSHRTRIPNVLQAGQNINSHGMLGVLVGTIVACSEILTAQKILNQIAEANEENG
ncbi:MAG: NAD(P)/FAD-dependent oxidoreductase [Bacteroidaceae bacterium]|nr:NAD(P)/FAD-dependent oxidoreductase [Bacteroidaceae bacterium]